MMEKDSSHIVQVPRQGKQTTLGVVVPDLDSIIISSRHKHGLGLVKVNASDRAIVFFISINQGAHAVVP
jgi:hypothetical protein